MLLKLNLLSSLAFIGALSSISASDTLQMGVSLGTSFHETKAKNTGNSFSNDFMKNSYNAGIFLGYDYKIKETPFFIGIEGELGSHAYEKSSDTDLLIGGTLKLSSNMSKIVGARFGVSSNDASIYVNTGLAHTNWKVSLNNQTENITKKFQRFGMVIGGGVETSLNQNFVLGMEHNYISYNALENIIPGNSFKMVPLIQTTRIRLSYRF